MPRKIIQDDRGKRGQPEKFLKFPIFLMNNSIHTKTDSDR